MTELNQANAFNPGHDLWVLPDSEESFFVPKIDWYLNFVIAKSKAHKTASISEKISYILEKTELENFEKPHTDGALLIPSHHSFPNQWIMIEPFSSGPQWVRAVFKKWSQMQKPSLRIFLPKKLSRDEFQKIWHAEGGDDSISLVTAVSPLN